MRLPVIRDYHGVAGQKEAALVDRGSISINLERDEKQDDRREAGDPQQGDSSHRFVSRCLVYSESPARRFYAIDRSVPVWEFRSSRSAAETEPGDKNEANRARRWIHRGPAERAFP